jgi:hypothetical protein
MIQTRNYKIRQAIDVAGGEFFFNITFGSALLYVVFLIVMDQMFPAQNVLKDNGGIDYLIVFVAPFLLSLVPVKISKHKKVK